MEKVKKKNTLRRTLRLILWVLLFQFVLINISAFSYAYKFTHLYSAEEGRLQKLPSNVFARTWRLFTGPRLYKQVVADKPDSAYESVHLRTTNNLAIEGWYCKRMPLDSIENANDEVMPDTSTRGTVILFHGYTGNR